MHKFTPFVDRKDFLGNAIRKKVGKDTHVEAHHSFGLQIFLAVLSGQDGLLLGTLHGIFTEMITFGKIVQRERGTTLV
jgi:hypothetical protein